MTPEHARLMQSLRAFAGEKKLALALTPGGSAVPVPEGWALWEGWKSTPSGLPVLEGALALSALAEGCVQAVLMGEALTVCAPEEVKEVLAQACRVLAWGGELQLSVPDLQTLGAYLSGGQDRIPGADAAVSAVLFSDADAPARCGFTVQTLTEALVQAGFCNLTLTRERTHIVARARKLPGGHTQRRDKPQLRTGAGFPPRAAIAATVDRLAELPHPGLMRSGALPDELDIPPCAL